jgi:hypothetical protein
MEQLQIRRHDHNPYLWWVSSHGDDVAYITQPGKNFLVWPTGSIATDIAGTPFESIDAALAAVERSLPARIG